MATSVTPDPPSQTHTSSPILSNSPSVTSESFSTSAAATSLPNYLTNPTPLPEYISQPNATRIASLARKEPVQPVPGQEPGEDDLQDDVERALTVVSVSAVAMFNLFLDKLLFDILYSSRSADLVALKQAALTVIRKSLGRDAVASAEANLEDLLAVDDDETDDDLAGNDDAQAATAQRRGSMAKWNQESAWKRSRLRVMMRGELSDFDIDDDERYAQATASSEFRSSQIPVKLTLSAELFLAGIMDFVAEHFITLAAPLAVNRANRRSLRTKAPPTPHTLVDEPDIEKAFLNSSLDRNWRAWRKSLRSRPYSTASQRLAHLSISTATGSPTAEQRRSSSNSFSAPAGPAPDDTLLPSTMPGTFDHSPPEWHTAPNTAMPDIPEHQHPEPLASNSVHPNGHASDPLGSKWAPCPPRRQSGPVSANNVDDPVKQRSASLPTIPKHPVINTAPRRHVSQRVAPQGDLDDDRPTTAMTSKTNGTDKGLGVHISPHQRKGSAVSGVSSILSDMSTPEIVSGFEANEVQTAKGYSAGTAAIIRHVSSRDSSNRLDKDYQRDEQSDSNSPSPVKERALSPKNPNREAAVGMDYQRGITMPDSTSAPRTVPIPDTDSPTVPQMAQSPASVATASPALESRPDPPEPVHISKIRAQRAQSEAKQGGISPALSGSSPKLGLRARATSQSRADVVRSDSLRRLAAENNSGSQVSLVGESGLKSAGRSPLLGSSRSVHSVDDFDALITGGETIKMTLSPQSVRDGSVEIAASPKPLEFQNQQKEDRKLSKPEPLTSNDSIIEEEGSPDANGNHKPRATFPRPHHMRNKTIIGRPAPQAREAVVQTHSTSDFADFIRSTGPNNQPQPSNITALPNPVKPGSAGGRSRLGTSSSNRSLGVGSASPQVTSRTGLKIGSRFKAKDAKGENDGGTADLIDLIRNGPTTGGRGGGTKVDKSIAPFRTTMDSDELKALTDKVNTAIATGSGTPSSSSFMSRPNRASIATTATGHTFSTFNSRAPLVGNNKMTSSTAPSIISAIGASSPGSEHTTATPRMGGDGSPATDDDGRRRYRNKDIYALPSDSDDDELSKPESTKTGISSGFLIENNGTSTRGKAVAGRPPAGLALDGVQYHPSSSATIESGSLKGPAFSRPGTGANSLSRPGSRPRHEMKSPGSASKAFKKAEMADASRQTRDLADFLMSGPAPGSSDKGSMGPGFDDDEHDGAPAPNVGHMHGASTKKSKFWKRSKKQDL